MENAGGLSQKLLKQGNQGIPEESLEPLDPQDSTRPILRACLTRLAMSCTPRRFINWARCDSTVFTLTLQYQRDLFRSFAFSNHLQDLALTRS